MVILKLQQNKQSGELSTSLKEVMIASEKEKWTSPFDGSIIQGFKPARGTIQEWRRGKCFSVFCRNGIIYVHQSRKGFWDCGYCNGDYRARIFENAYKKIKEQGNWFLAGQGKLKPVRKEVSLERLK